MPLVFAVLFHDLGKPATKERDATGRIRFSGHESVSARMTEKIMKRLRFSNEEVQATVEMVQNHMVFKDVQSMRVARLKRFMARPTFSDELELHRVDCLASHGLLDNYEFLKRRRDEFANEPLIPRPFSPDTISSPSAGNRDRNSRPLSMPSKSGSWKERCERPKRPSAWVANEYPNRLSGLRRATAKTPPPVRQNTRFRRSE